MLQLGDERPLKLQRFLAARHVLRNPGDSLNFAQFIQPRKIGIVHPSNLAVRAHDPELLVRRRSAPRLPEDVDCSIPVVGMDQLEPSLDIVSSQHFFAGYAIQFLERRAEILERQAFRVADPEEVGGKFAELTEPLLAFARGVFTELAIGDVLTDLEKAGDFVPIIAKRNDLSFNEDPAPVLVLVPSDIRRFAVAPRGRNLLLRLPSRAILTPSSRSSWGARARSR